MSLQCKHPEEGASQQPPTCTCQGGKSLSHLNWLPLPAVAKISLPIPGNVAAESRMVFLLFTLLSKQNCPLQSKTHFSRRMVRELLLSSVRLRALTGEIVCVEEKEGQSRKWQNSLVEKNDSAKQLSFTEGAVSHWDCDDTVSVYCLEW